MRENNPSRSIFSRFLSLLSRLWQRLIGRAAPTDGPFINLEIPELNVERPELELRIPELLLPMARLDLGMYAQNTVDLRDRGIVARPNRNELELALALPRTEPYLGRIMSQLNLDPRFFRNMQNDRPWREETEQFFRHQQQTAREEAYQWWRRQNPFAALPDPENFRNSSKLAAHPNLDIPEAFICVITREIMTDPVYDPNFPQQRYDRHAIERWLTDYPTNPYTRTPLTVVNLVADDSLKACIDEFVANVLQTSVALTPRKSS